MAEQTKAATNVEYRSFCGHVLFNFIKHPQVDNLEADQTVKSHNPTVIRRDNAAGDTLSFFRLIEIFQLDRLFIFDSQQLNEVVYYDTTGFTGKHFTVFVSGRKLLT